MVSLKIVQLWFHLVPSVLPWPAFENKQNFLIYGWANKFLWKSQHLWRGMSWRFNGKFYLRIVQVFVVVTSVVNASWLSCVSNMTTIITTTNTITGNNSTTGQSRQLRLYDCHHNFHFHYWDIYRLSDFYEHYTPPTRERAPIV